MQTPRESHLTGLPENAIFAAVGGLLDAFMWLAHGRTFANSMTANLVLLVLNTVQHDWGSAWHHLIAIVSFVLGIATARSLCLTRLADSPQKADVATLGLEMIIFASVSLMPASASDTCVIFCVAFAASLQVEAFKVVEGYPYNSTFTTGNLRTLVEGICEWVARRRNGSDRMALVFATICGSFCGGALAGGLLARTLGNHTLWLVILLLSYPMQRLFTREKHKSVSAGGWSQS